MYGFPGIGNAGIANGGIGDRLAGVANVGTAGVAVGWGKGGSGVFDFTLVVRFWKPGGASISAAWPRWRRLQRVASIWFDIEV